MGVDHFFLIDNGSNDDPYIILKKFIRSRLVTLYIDFTPFQQVKNYNIYLELCKEYEWVMVVDLDEFMYSKNNYDTITDYLRTLDDSIGCINIPLKMFGSSGYRQQPSSVISSLTRRQSHNTTTMVKSIIRTKYLEKLHIHNSQLLPCQTINSMGQPIDHINSIAPQTEEIIIKSYLNLNHYPIQSYEWFKNVKMTRGDVAYSEDKYQTIRNNQYFKEYDHNEIEDNELKEITQKKKKELN